MKYNENTCAVELSVRSLCETVLREGDLGAHRFGEHESVAARKAVFAKRQAELGATYRCEVSLCHTQSHKELYYTVSGEADGILRTESGYVVELLQCVRRSELYATPPEALLARLRCHAYFFAASEGLEHVCARLVLHRAEDGKQRILEYDWRTAELSSFYESLLERLRPRAELCRRRTVEERPTAASARFPHRELREGQEWMIRECYGAIKHGKRLFVEAPTGTGKTISALYPAVRALGEGRVDKIFYLTAKASTRREAYRAAAELFSAGARLRTVVMTAKEQSCMCHGRLLPENMGKSLCNGRDCEFARDYYGRMEEAVFSLLESGNGYPRQQIEQTAKHFRVCPYELSLDLSELCDIVICDYNYAFDPTVYFRRYFSSDADEGRYVFLVDEAHNLPDRARAMYSSTLSLSSLDALLSELSEEDSALVGEADSLRRAFLCLRDLCGDTLSRDAEGREYGYWASKSLPQNFGEAVERFALFAEKWQRTHREHPAFGRLWELRCALRRYQLLSLYFDRGFLCYVRVAAEELSVQLCCLDPCHILDSLLCRAKATVFFSATLTPFDYYASLLGGAKKAETLSLPSPFDPARLCVAVADYVSTRMETRGQSIGRFATLIAATVSARPGNYIAYFPSYACLEDVLRAFQRKYPKVETVVQKQSMGIREKEEFLSAFRDDVGHLRVGFCVLGGAFSEGVDLPGSRLIGAIVFGVGLPALSDERNMIRDYTDPDGAEGYDYAYTYPGMNHVLQAAGRVIRRDDDRGIVVLADDRYALPKYRALMPSHWEGVQYAGNARSLAEIVRRFWDDGELCE